MGDKIPRAALGAMELENLCARRADPGYLPETFAG
jgi:hypothetical protein